MRLLGNHDVVTVGPLRLWAERGLIHIEDSRDNSYKVESVREMLMRVSALNDMQSGITGTESAAEKAAIYEERTRVQGIVDGMLDVVRKAREQGMPTDESAVRSLNRSKKKTVRLPTVVDMEGF